MDSAVLALRSVYKLFNKLILYKAVCCGVLTSPAHKLRLAAEHSMAATNHGQPISFQFWAQSRMTSAWSITSQARTEPTHSMQHISRTSHPAYRADRND